MTLRKVVYGTNHIIIIIYKKNLLCSIHTPKVITVMSITFNYYN